jgi:hypothetical protein
MRWKVVILIILILFVGYVYITSLNGVYEPQGRLGFVKLKNPDMWKGNPHSKLVAKTAKEKGSNTVLVVHYAGHTTGYPCYKEGDVMILELGFQDKKAGYSLQIKWNDVLQGFLYGVPDGRYQYVSDGIVFQHLDDALAYLDKKAAQNGQKGPRLIFWHGTVKSGNPLINQGCGFPLYYQILDHEYGRLAAYYYVLTGMIFPYFNDPYRNFEIQHAAELQYYYTHNMLNYLD